MDLASESEVIVSDHSLLFSVDSESLLPILGIDRQETVLGIMDPVSLAEHVMSERSYTLAASELQVSSWPLEGLTSDLSKVFSIQFVLNAKQKPAGVFTGELWGSFAEAIELARDIYVVPLERRYPIVVVVHSEPLDRNLYQLQKAFENTISSVENGGLLVVVSKCSEGIGNREFFELAGKYPDPEGILELECGVHPLGFHKLFRTAQHLKRVRIRLVSDLKAADVRAVYLEPAGDLNALLSEELARLGNEAKVLFINDAGYLVPDVGDSAKD